ncbi:MAG TPA: DUF2938 domain-containing protein [Steroidobacteraceae bacterium]|nr:DUF2938 domain-containing protein [Steroidobacteraceae bacterium]
MSELAEFILRAVAIGVGATVVMDLWAVLLQRLFSVQPSNWAMVGRWVGHFSHGQFRHDRIADAASIRGERALGWMVHYLTGITYGALLLGICGLAWARRPTLLPPLVLSLVALLAPFFLLQPGMGLGVAGARTPDPNATRLRSVLNHTVFGLGLYVSALLCAQA